MKTTNLASLITRKNRQLIETPDGPFVIRKVQGTDFFESGAVLPSGKRVDVSKGDQHVTETIRKDIKENAANYYNTLVVRGVISDLVVKEDGGFHLYSDYDTAPGPEAEIMRTAKVALDRKHFDIDENTVLFEDLDDETKLMLIAEVEKFSGMGETVGDRLSRFRESKRSDDRSTGKEVRKTTDRDPESDDGGDSDQRDDIGEGGRTDVEGGTSEES